MLDTVGKRLRKARKDAGMTQKELADAVDAKQGAVSDLENGRNNSSTKLVEMALTLGVNPRWLSTGEGDIIGGNFWESDAKDEGIPLYSIYVIQALLRGEGPSPADYEPCPKGINKDGLFWISIEDDSMAPEFNQNDRVLFTTKLDPKPSYNVIATIDGTEDSLFRKWRPKGFDEATGKEYWQLVPCNPDYPIADSRFTPFSIYAVAVAHKRQLIILK